MVKVSRYTYLVANYLFLVGVFVQVFLAGMVVVAVRLGWEPHISLGHGLGLPLIIMLIFQYLGRLPRKMKVLTWALFANYFIQADVVIFLRKQAPVVSALHPVLALVDAILGFLLVREAMALMREPVMAPAGLVEERPRGSP